MTGIFQTLVAASFCWLVTSSLFVSHSLSYASEWTASALSHIGILSVLLC